MGGNAADWIKECSLYSKASLHLSIKRILCILIYLVYLQHSEEKKKDIWFRFSQRSESFLPTCPFWKNFFSFYCDFNELPHMPSFCPAPTAQVHMEGPGWAARAMSMHSFALLTSCSSDKLAAVWKLLLLPDPSIYHPL